MFKLGYFVKGEWSEYSHPPVFKRQLTSANTTRLDVGVPGGDVAVLGKLTGCMEPPYHILYVLVVPRGEGDAGRYQSPLVDRGQLASFLARYEAYLKSDGRFALWVHSQSSQATLVWDRHNLIYAYGPLACFEEALTSIGFTPGSLTIPTPHEHHYRQECDADAAAIMSHFGWRYSELRPGDDC
jgi:hypothetical protein